VFSRIRNFFSGVFHRIGSFLRRPIGAVIALVVVAGAAIGVLFATGVINTGGEEASEGPAPPVVVTQAQPPDQPQDVGFPDFATKNTTRVSGADPVADAAGVALAVFPSTGGLPGPDAVTLVDAGDWPSGVAASSLMAAPVGAPLLLTSGGEVPSLTSDALSALAPEGSAATGKAQVFQVGAAAKVKGLRTETVRGRDPAEVASSIDHLREKLVGEQPPAILVTTADEPGYAMPAAAWAARSGDTILFAERNSVPKATLQALHRHEDVPVYVLGPDSVISDKAVKQLERVSGDIRRIEAHGEVESAIAFARYAAGGFGWDINDPGHGFVIANAERPMDAAAAAPLSASGTWGPLLVTDSGHKVPGPLRSYLLDLKPGYLANPTRAVYNHVWLIGDSSAVSVAFQAQVDELAEVAQVRSGSGGSSLPTPGGKPPSQQGKHGKSE
jgi:hypothetical protein